VWRTTPVGGPPQPDFYNAAIAVRFRAPSSLQELMRSLLFIEARFGRVRAERNAPRTLDLDMLWVEGQRALISGPDAPEVEVPHPRLHERAFAMIPLLEVVPGATDPVSGKLYAEILSEVGTEGVSPLDSHGS
jgi:2-amino-4-hydroxy-6-hydroxymethyldihydropteridine diphosphokinase